MSFKPQKAIFLCKNYENIRCHYKENFTDSIGQKNIKSRRDV